MSYNAALAKLAAPVRELVQDSQKALPNYPAFTGKTEKDQSEVVTWLEKAGEIKEDSFPDLNSTLTPKTYLVSNYLTAADVAVYGTLQPIIVPLQPPPYKFPSLVRYFDHIQSTEGVKGRLPAVTFNFDDVPKIERKAELVGKKKEKPEKAAPAPVPEAKEKKKEKEKKPKEAVAAEAGGKKKGGADTGSKAAPANDDPAPYMVDLRVGKIIEVQKHPDADSLYLEKIDLGEDTGPRTVVSGLVNYVPIEKMRDRTLVCVCNFKPANMRGIKSFALVLCAVAKEGKDVGGIELVEPPPGSKPGDRVYFEGFEDKEPVSQMNPKKKIWETIQPGFASLDNKETAWIDPKTGSVHRIVTKAGVVVAPTMAGASLS